MNKTYNVNWSKTALDELNNTVAYPLKVKERIYLDSYILLSFMPTLTAKQIPKHDSIKVIVNGEEMPFDNATGL